MVSDGHSQEMRKHTHNEQDQQAPSFMTTARIEAFSDGVFAVAITLLVLNIQLPPPPPHLDRTQVGAVAAYLLSALFELWPKFLVYALSFVIVGIYWVGHHNTFHYIKRADRILLWLNILFLLFIVFIPFPTSLVGEFSNQPTSIVVYGGTLIATGCVLEALWLHATHQHRLVDGTIDPLLVRRATRRNLVGPCIYLLAIAVSFLSTWLSLVLFILVPVFYIMPGRIDIHWTHGHDHMPLADRSKKS